MACTRSHLPFLRALPQTGHGRRLVSFVSTPRNISSIKRLVEPDRGHIDLVELPLPSVEGLPNGAESTADVPNEMIPLLLKAVDMWENPFETLLRQLRPHRIIHDFAQCRTPRLAAKLGIPSFFFRLSLAELLPVFFAPYQEAWLEGKYLEHLRRSTGKPVFPVGPMLVQPAKQTRAVPETETPYCLAWLNDRAPSSVVYVSMGSECFPSQEQIHALALGLEASHVPFLWALRFPDNDVEKCLSAVLPEGFECRTRDRGLVIGGMKCGVAMICLPMQYKQGLTEEGSEEVRANAAKFSTILGSNEFQKKNFADFIHHLKRKASSDA
eukprot:Gb_25837 [translate_table: standard]